MRFPLEAAEGVAEPFSSTNFGNLTTEDPLGLFDFSNSGFSSTFLIPFGHSMLRVNLYKKVTASVKKTVTKINDKVRVF